VGASHPLRLNRSLPRTQSSAPSKKRAAPMWHLHMALVAIDHAVAVVVGAGAERRSRLRASYAAQHGPLTAPAPLWQEEMMAEQIELGLHGAFSECVLSRGCKPVGSTWGYTVNRGVNILELMARLVATGFSQRDGIYYTALYAPVGKKSPFWVFGAIMAGRGLARRGYDVPSAFLKRDELRGMIYMRGLTRPSAEVV
jgi:hypothetical protein